MIRFGHRFTITTVATLGHYFSIYSNNCFKYLEKSQSDVEPQLNTLSFSVCHSLLLNLVGCKVRLSCQHRTESLIQLLVSQYAVSRMDAWLAHCYTLPRVASLHSWIMTAEAQKVPIQNIEHKFEDEVWLVSHPGESESLPSLFCFSVTHVLTHTHATVGEWWLLLKPLWPQCVVLGHHQEGN